MESKSEKLHFEILTRSWNNTEQTSFVGLHFWRSCVYCYVRITQDRVTISCAVYRPAATDSVITLSFTETLQQQCREYEVTVCRLSFYYTEILSTPYTYTWAIRKIKNSTLRAANYRMAQKVSNYQLSKNRISACQWEYTHTVYFDLAAIGWIHNRVIRQIKVLIKQYNIICWY